MEAVDSTERASSTHFIEGLTIVRMTLQFSTRQWIPFPVELVFAFFANPANLPLLMPPAMEARIESVHFQAPPRPPTNEVARSFRSVAAGIGSEILVSFRALPGIPWRTAWRAQITEFEWNSHFCDEQVSGPFAQFRHRHGTLIESKDGAEGTVVSDEIGFALPFGFAGRIAVPFVRWQMARAFAYRQRRLPEMLKEAMERAVGRP